MRIEFIRSVQCPMASFSEDGYEPRILYKRQTFMSDWYFWSIISLHEVRYRASTFALPKKLNTSKFSHFTIYFPDTVPIPKVVRCDDHQGRAYSIFYDSTLPGFPWNVKDDISKCVFPPLQKLVTGKRFDDKGMHVYVHTAGMQVYVHTAADLWMYARECSSYWFAFRPLPSIGRRNETHDTDREKD